MPSKTYKSNKEPISFADWSADIAKRKRESSIAELPRNSGSRRTQSKQALIEALERSGAKW